MTSNPEIPAPHHLVDGMTVNQVSEHLIMLPFAGIPTTAPCVVGVPTPDGSLAMHRVARVLTTRIHPAEADPDDPFQPEGQDVIVILADPFPTLQSQKRPLSPPSAV